MDNWEFILKDTKQISSTGIKTKLGTRPLRIINNNDCCENAKMEYRRVQTPRNTNFTYEYTTMADKLNCDNFKLWLKGRQSYKKQGWIKRIVDEWEACENA